MSALPLTIGLNPSPYTQALFDGLVRSTRMEIFEMISIPPLFALRFSKVNRVLR
jgi:hypothetical protein